MPTPPDTGSYLILGLAVIAVIMAILLASMAIRYRNLRKDVETIRRLETEL
ncbi:MAG: hypothetical protein DIU68_007745 [Chloroflexota bacterium]